MTKIQSHVTDLGIAESLFLRRGNPGMPVECVIGVGGETLVVTVPYTTLLQVVADGAGFLASRPDLFQPKETP